MKTLFDLKPTYRQHAVNMLSDLAQTAEGKALRKDLQVALRIPKASMSEILQTLRAMNAVRVRELYPVMKSSVIEITWEGRQILDQYDRVSLPPAMYVLPDSVKQYLNIRGRTESSLFKVQKIFLQRGLIASSANVAVFSPPATGKTLIAEVVIAYELSRQGKTLYCTPYKALDWQKYKDFEKWFGRLDRKVVVTDGDQKVSAIQLNDADIVIATYERALGAVRHNESWLDKVTLVCADEINILGEDRGAIVDLLLSQLATKGVRILTLSSPMGNALEVSEWLRAERIIAPPENEIEEFVAYNDAQEIVLLGKDGKQERFPATLGIIPSLVSRNLANQETTIIFVEARFIAEYVARALKPIHKTMDDELVQAAKAIKDSVREATPLIEKLCSLLPCGIAFHHAGLPREARRVVERLLDERKLRTVVATTTLSHGVDYSIDNVIVALIERARRWELDRYLYVNLKGRAGRPGKSKLGTGRAYIVSEASRAKKCWRDYFYGELERLYPTPPTIAREPIAVLVLSTIDEAKRINKKKAMQLLSDLLQRTISRKPSRRRMATLARQVTEDMRQFGFLQQKDELLLRTPLGSLVNKLDLQPYEARMILEQINTVKSKHDLLKLTVSVDVAKSVRREIPKRSDTDPVSVLSAWIKGLTLTEITDTYRFWDDFDVEQLAKYSAVALQKIGSVAGFIGLKSVEKQASKLRGQITKKLKSLSIHL